MSAKEETIGFIRRRLKTLNDDWKFHYRQSDYNVSNAIYEDIQEFEILLKLCVGEKQPGTENKCNKHIVTQQSELLKGFCSFLFTEMAYTTETDYTPEEQVEIFLKTLL